MSDELLSPDDLGRVLRDKLVVDCVRWYDVGLGLGFKKERLDIIEADCRGDNKTADCKRKMFSEMLNNIDPPTMGQLHKVINEVNERDKREKRREETSKNEEEAVKATSMLLHLLDEWENTNQELYDDKQQRAKELQGVKNWMEDIIKRKWKEEDMQEEHVHAMERAEKIQEALRMARNYHFNSFVRKFLREKGYSNPSDVNDKLIVGMLRQALLDIEIERGKILKERFRQSLEHKKKLKNINSEIESIRQKINERLVAYNKIKYNLDQIGAKQQRIEKLNDQMRELNNELEEFDKIILDCDETECHLREELSNAKDELKRHISLLDRIARLMKSNERQYTSQLKLNFVVTDRVRVRDGEESEIWERGTEGARVGGVLGGVTGAAAGAMAGAVAGTTTGVTTGTAAIFVAATLGTSIVLPVFPVIGAVAVGALGTAAGAAAGASVGASGAIIRAFLRRPWATRANDHHEISNLTANYRESIKKGRYLVKGLQNLLD